MAFHIGIVVLITLLGLLTLNNNKKLDNLYLILSYIILFVVSAFRSINVGSDTGTYYQIFSVSSEINMSMESLLHQRYEFGYLLFSKAVRFFTDNFQWILILSTLIVLTLWFFVIYKLSDNYFLSVFIFVNLKLYYYTLSAVRMSIALSIITLAYYFLVRKKYVKSLLFIVIASCFHVTALSFLIIYVCSLLTYKFNISIKKIFILLIIGAYLIYFSFDKLMIIFTSIFGKYKSYLGSSYLDGSTNVSSIITLLLLGGLLVITLIIINLNIKAKKEFYEAESTNIMGIVLCVLFAFLALKTGMINRIISYYMIFFVFVIPKAFCNIKLIKYRWSVEVIILIILAIYNFGILYYKPEWSNIYPYTFFTNY